MKGPLIAGLYRIKLNSLKELNLACATNQCDRLQTIVLPLKKKQFRAEGWSHSANHAVAARAAWPVQQEVLHDGEDRG